DGASLLCRLRYRPGQTPLIGSAAMLIAAYLPADRRRALAEGYDLPDRTTGAGLFADISGFTPLAEALAQALGPRHGAEELARHLNRVYDVLIAEIDSAGGSVIFFSGDGIICWFDESVVPGSLSFASADTQAMLDNGQGTRDNGLAAAR